VDVILKRRCKRLTCRCKTANITKDDITYAAHRQNVTVLQSNIIFCDIWCFTFILFIY